MSLKEAHNHQEESVWRETTEIRIIKLACFQELFQNQDEWLNDFILCEELLDKSHTLKSVVMITHLSYVNVEGLLKEVTILFVHLNERVVDHKWTLSW